MSVSGYEDIGLHYVHTLRAWRDRFHGALPEVRRLGFDDRFIRMWEYYLEYCEAAFTERHVSDVQLVFAKERGLEPATTKLAATVIAST